MNGTDASSRSPEPPRSGFPQSPEDFDADPRISFSKLDGKFILEADDGQEYEFDDALKRWVLVLDDALLEKQREAYAVKGVDEAEPAQPQKKRKQVYVNGEDETGGRINPSKKSKSTAEPRERKNTAVYVTSLPTDVTVDEVSRVFSRCGVIAEEIDRGKPRIKLYTDDAGNFKGDALIVYFRAESVELAIQMLDDTDFRLGEPAPSGKMRVTPADFSYKTQKDAPAKSSNNKDKQKIIKKTQKLNNKLADWDDDDPSALPDTSSRWDKVVILKHMFTLAELEEDPAAILDIKEDIREECAKLGDVTNVVLFDKEPDGVASVRYGNAEAAKACVRVMDGRFFSGTKVEAYIADGNEKFKKSSEKKLGTEEEGEEDAEADDEGRRLDKFGSWLEEEGGRKGVET
ncbi:nuclear mrna splicing factor-associated [Lasallia pustulata]|uniref:Nuclear mrna splicing factor-associated n=1 Tax=Lasallia pustulata TaxID=136370 RepID=A0A1W5DEF6_9LECA|nr:nuclear mrna splicing factor-associated [Lasallia pustulata]